ncbi:MAG TPA: four helix bundle protein [Gemmatimonadaceae bacterium]
MGNFRNLLVWQKSHALSTDAFEVAQRIQGTMHSKLRDEIVRSAESVPTNIVEGCASRGPREYARFVSYAISSATEFEHHLLTGRARRVLTDADFGRLHEQVVEVRKMLHGLLKALRRKASDDGAA